MSDYIKAAEQCEALVEQVEKFLKELKAAVTAGVWPVELEFLGEKRVLDASGAAYDYSGMRMAYLGVASHARRNAEVYRMLAKDTGEQ